MNNEIVRTTAGVEVAVNYPNGLPVEIVFGLVVNAVNELFITGYKIKTALVEIRNEAQIAIQFYEDRSRIICEEYVPVAATWAAYQWGKNMIRQLRLPPEDQQEAFNDLAKTLKKTRQMLEG